MKSELTQINLALAWLWILMGFVSGMVLGMFFRGENWLGGYASFKRRMYRLGHISFFGLGAVNLLFCFTVQNFALSGELVHFASLAFVTGSIAMPLCCLVMAHFPQAHLIFAVPVISLIAGGLMMLALVAHDSKAIGAANTASNPADHPSLTINTP